MGPRRASPVMHEILPHLYLSGWRAASDSSQLERHGITHVVNASGVYVAAHERLQVLTIEVEDADGVNICRHFSKVNRFVHTAWIKIRQEAAKEETESTTITTVSMKSKEKRSVAVGAILIHCMMGQSRSVALVLAYLGQKHKMTFEQAMDCLRHAGVYLGELNNGFADQVERRIQSWSMRTF